MNQYIIEFFDEYSKYYTDQDLKKLKDLIEKELEDRQNKRDYIKGFLLDKDNQILPFFPIKKG